MQDPTQITLSRDILSKPISFTLRECHTTHLPSPSTCFGNLRVCLRSEGERSHPFVALSSSNHASFELVKSRRTPYKIVLSGDERAKRKKRETAPEKEDDNEKKKEDESKKDDKKEDATETELIVSTDVIGGDGENWEDWSDPNSTAVEAVAVRKQTGPKVSYSLRISRRHHQGRERRRGSNHSRAAKAGVTAEKKEKKKNGDGGDNPERRHGKVWEDGGSMVEGTEVEKYSKPEEAEDGKNDEKQKKKTNKEPEAKADAAMAAQPTQTIELNYAPLVLHLTYLPRSYVKTLTLLVSSNDDSSIRIYQPLENNLGEFQEITDSEVKEKVFPTMCDTFPSSILTLDSTFTSAAGGTYEYHAVVGCKNGYIRVISFNPQRRTQRFTNFYIDGPISTVQLCARSGGEKEGRKVLQLLVGSLAGFACIYTQDWDQENAEGDGGKRGMGFGKPLVFMVGPNDAVICIYLAKFPSLSGTSLFVGTHSGKIMVFDRVLEPPSIVDEEDAEGEKNEVRGEVPETPEYWNWKSDASSGVDEQQQQQQQQILDEKVEEKGKEKEKEKGKVEEVREVEAVETVGDVSKEKGEKDDKVDDSVAGNTEDEAKTKLIPEAASVMPSNLEDSASQQPKQNPETTANEVPTETSPSTPTPLPDKVVLRPTYKLVETRQLPHPVHKFGVGDIDSDGVNELVVLTKETIHVFKRDDEEIVQVCEAKKRILADRNMCT